LTLTFPDSWQRTASGPSVPGLTLANPLSLSPGGSAAQGALQAGQTGATDHTLLPAAFLAALPSKPQPNDPVHLGKVQAYRYKGLKPKGFTQALTVYAVPTS